MFVFYLFAAILVYFSYKSLIGGINYLNFFKEELAKPKSDFTPYVSIIAPCKGLDQDLEANLKALFEQDYPNYEIIFVVDSENDESLEIIRNLQGKDSEKQIIPKIVVASKATNSSQKVENLREAILHVSDNSKVFVFVDSDARPNKTWLSNLVAPLQDKNVGCSTGYRWFIGKTFNFPTELRSVWNASIASALGEDTKSNFCWGGSMAIRRKTFEDLQIREKWKGVLSDDFAMRRAMKEANLPIRFVPQCLTASVENCTFGELFEFTTRQMKITRVYSQNLWILSFIGSGLFLLVWIWGILNLIFSPLSSFTFWFTTTSLLLITIFSIGKSYLRLEAVKLVLKDYKKDLNKQFWTQNTLWFFTPFIFFYNNFLALISRNITWRGIKYQLKSSTETVIISDNGE